MLPFRTRRFYVTWGLLLIVACPRLASAAEPGTSERNASDQKIHLFNGKNLDGWYVFTEQTKFENPGVFQVVDGTIYAPGGNEETAYLGGLITRQSYKNYRLKLEYKWGERTYGHRQGKARDAGVLLHCFGPNGPGPWMNSFEFQIIEGGTGDLLVVKIDPRDGEDDRIALTCIGEIEKRAEAPYFKPGGEQYTFKNDGRLNWWGRDLKWQDVTGFRGREDLASPHGEWTTCEIVARGNSLEYYVNGKLANRAAGLSVSAGKIFLQTEGAELWYRNIELMPLNG
ncbi:MAG: DUF1080 domain-containing protein [Pirellulales bacterium]|nr:DUF1080 domain-containing protein [Pirellulales bacterium]